MFNDNPKEHEDVIHSVYIKLHAGYDKKKMEDFLKQIVKLFALYGATVYEISAVTSQCNCLSHEDN